ncbi:MAG: tRNA (N(6)-L-threonylcarbamoyladenosine(37)-C(2))-methylthiotransferase MtaB [Holosporales bacterium]|jgi:threonylcarbamoyladenosine tRNA methylthiotransferase MtaB|nr:tRNA (N(6)-L-threonylcarbamoyladenosine(37)-C(2))-methylthiotransferase MtaB [Holosporales bacterium]
MPKNQQVITFGCRLNTFESEHIKHVLKQNDLHDVIVVNTCAVTAEAERQARQAIRKLKLAHPDKRIVVTGCAATISREAFEGMPQVDRVISNEQKDDPQLFAKALTAGILPSEERSFAQLKEHSPYQSKERGQLEERSAEQLNVLSSQKFIPNFEGKSRAFLQIQTGCDNCCSFCVIRIARGKSVSYPISQILAQAQQFADKGYQEINLTGVNITSFDSEGHRLAELINLLLEKIPTVRIRLSSLDPGELNDALYDVMRNERVLPHWHLSIQSGDSTVLARMLRRHTPDDIVSIVNRVRQTRPEIAIGADIIVGFPGETQDMFENSCALVRKCKIALLHVFPYSERPGTVASTLPQKVPPRIKVERAQLLRQIGTDVLREVLQLLVGTEVVAFVEQEMPSELSVNEAPCYSGKTEHFFRITICGQGAPIGRFVKVQVERILSDDSLFSYWKT